MCLSFDTSPLMASIIGIDDYLSMKFILLQLRAQPISVLLLTLLHPSPLYNICIKHIKNSQ